MTVLPLALALLFSPVGAVDAPPAGLAAPVVPVVAAAGTGAGAGAAPRGVPPLAPLSVVAPFDPPGSTYAAGHRGVDLAGTSGQAVVAALPGTVTHAGTIAGVPVVVVSHGELRTTYQPVSAVVAVGDQVAAGQTVGTLTALGTHCAPVACLHWGLKRGEEYLDPMTLLGPRRVRLLPLRGIGG